MARQLRLLWLVLRVWHMSSLCLHFQSSICLAERVLDSQKASFHNQNNRLAGLHLETSNDVTIRVGELLQLNCSLIGAANSSQLSWYHEDQILSNRTTRLSNKTIQLVIEQVDWIDGGSYVCKEIGRNNTVQPKSVTVTVGDIPSPPQDVWINNVEFKTRIHWKVPLCNGGLTLKYAVKGKCVLTSNISNDQLSKCNITLCGSFYSIKQEPGPGSDSFFCEVNELLDFLNYTAYVEAINDVGTGVSNPVEFTWNIYMDPLLTTPSPGVFLGVKEMLLPGTVKVSWKDAKAFKPPDLLVEYTILYHREGDSYNKSKIVESSTDVLISDLVGLSWYYFYLMIRYGQKNSYSFHSEAAGRKFRTTVSAPKSPVISNCSSGSNLNSNPTLTVTWTIPEAEYFNGPSRNAVILYRCQRGEQSISGNVTSNNGSSHRVVIHILKPFDRCRVWMKLCNEPGQRCSGFSGICRVDGNTKVSSVSQSYAAKNSLTARILIAVAGTVGGLLLVFLVFMCYRNRHKRGERLSLEAVLHLPPIHGYDEMEESLEDDNYDKLESNTMNQPTEDTDADQSLTIEIVERQDESIIPE